MWFSGWTSIGRVVVFSLTAYALLIFLIRSFGQRTISKMNPSDFVITVAIGSTVATFILSKDTSLADGIAALAVLLVMQLATEWATTRSDAIRRTTEGHPALLMYRGEFLRDNMQMHHVNEHEVLSAIRQRGLKDPRDVKAVVLEVDGQFSVLAGRDGPEESLRDVRHRV